MAVALDVLLPALTVAGGTAAVVFTALRFNRDDATAVVNQQKTLLDGMRDLNAELQGALDRARVALQDADARARALDAEVDELRARLRAMEGGRRADDPR